MEAAAVSAAAFGKEACVSFGCLIHTRSAAAFLYIRLDLLVRTYVHQMATSDAELGLTT